MKRVLVVGCSGAGKSTLAAQIAEKTGLPYMATDSLYWKANWQAASELEVVSKIDGISQRPEWVLDGNFVDQRDLVWQRADTLIWLDYARWRVASRVMKRNLGWWLTKSQSGQATA